ncbi:glycosyltransferase family 1 protein [bacterium]|nr:glycosyltransferase family 1 protein [bacterium]
MAKILLYMAPTRGSLYPMVPVLQKLMENGHQTFAVVPECEVGMTNLQGISSRPISEAIECADYNDFEEPSHAEALQRALLCRVQRGRLEAEDLAFWASSIQPDLLIVDAHSFGAAAWAEGSGLPWASWATRLLPFPANNIPPFSLGLPLKQGAFSALKNLGKKGSIQRVYDVALQPLNDLRASQGAMPLNNVMEWPSQLKNLLYFTAEPFEYKRDWPESVRLVGPSTWECFPERIELTNDSRPVILVSCSCDFQNEVTMVQTVLDTIDPAEYQLAITTAAVDPQLFEGHHDVQIARFSAHLPILQRASCLICSGSLGVTQKALCCGVPVLAIPHGRDQVEIGQRLRHLKAGNSLHISQLTASSLRENLESTIACRPYAEELQQEFSHYDSASTAASIIDHLING